MAVDAKALFAALEGRLKAIVGAVPIAFENTKFQPTSGVAFVRVNHLPARSSLPSLGARHVREAGILQATVTFPAGSRTGAALALADAIRNGFGPGSVYTSGAVAVEIAGAASIAPAMTSPDWYALPVSIPYRAEILS